MVAELLDLQPHSVGICETHSLSRLRGTLSLIDRRQSDSGIGTCTLLGEEYGSGSWLWWPQTHTYLERERCRLLRPSIRLVLAMNSMDVGRREEARGVIDTAARYTVAGRVWDCAYSQICAERGIGHLINVRPESEVYRFGNGSLLTSTERVTVPVMLADHPLFLSYSVVESPVLSLLIGRDAVEGLGLDIKGRIQGSITTVWKTQWLDNFVA